MYLQCLEGCALCYELLLHLCPEMQMLIDVRIFAERRFPFFHCFEFSFVFVYILVI